MYDRQGTFALFEEQKENWEKKAKEGIERYRKGDVRLKVVDQQGNPVEGAEVRFVQKSHEFSFGANLFMLGQMETEEKNQQYEACFAELFNMATLPFYWNTLEPERGKPRYAADSPAIYRRPAPDSCIAFCKAHGIEPREHALAYDAFFPDWLVGASDEEVKQELDRRFREIAERYAHLIPTIEVTNEMEWQKGKTAFYDHPDFISYCFGLAEKYFPHNQLGINEHSPLAWQDRGRTTDKYYAYIENHLLKGVRIDAIGMQYHLFFNRDIPDQRRMMMLNPEKLYRHMDLYARLGKPLQITEITIPSYSWEQEDEEIQADLLENLYTIWFSHPAVEQIVYWNLVDGYAYCANPAQIPLSRGNMTYGENYFHGGLLRFDMTTKPAYERLKKLLKQTWHTEGKLSTAGGGEGMFRGFFGKYDLEITVGGKTVTKEIQVSKKADNNLTVVIQ